MREGTLVTVKSVARPIPRLRDPSGNPFKTLIVFMRSHYRWRSRRGHGACVGFCNTTREVISAPSFEIDW